MEGGKREGRREGEWRGRSGREGGEGDGGKEGGKGEGRRGMGRRRVDGEEEDVRLWCKEEEDELIKCYQSAQFEHRTPGAATI